jgi:hypothetical protein
VRKAAAIAGLVVGLAALILQFCLTIPAGVEAGRSLAGAIVFFFSFFTILTNMAVVAVYAADVFERPAQPGFFARSRVRAGVAVAIAAVCLVYIFVLAPLWRPEGLSRLADILLHYVTPILFILWWLLLVADGTTRWRDIPWWLAYPLLYVVYVMGRAPIAGEVPYPFLDLSNNSAAKVLESAFGILVLFVVLGASTVLADHVIAAAKNGRRRGGIHRDGQ